MALFLVIDMNKRIKDILEYVLIIVAVLLFRQFLYSPIRVSGESMVPTLNVDDRLFAHRVYNPENLDRGDLVIFYFEPKDELYIKRLIGLPNDEITIRDGIITINGEELVEDYVINQLTFNGDYKVPEGSYFFLGDNRANSGDSRFWDYPYIEAKDIKGKAFIKVYPFNDIGFVK